MKINYLSCVGLLYICLILNVPENKAQSDVFQQIDDRMQELFQNNEFNGALVIMDNDQTIYAQGFGYSDFEKQIPFNTNTTMDAASMTKTVTAMLVSLLEKEGKLFFEDPVIKYLSAFPYPQITLEHLMFQSSGLVSDDFVFDRAPDSTILTNQYFLDMLVQNQPALLFVPGTQFMYNDLNHILLAILIEKISGASFEQVFAQKIKAPLGLTNSFLRPARLTDWPFNRTLGYKRVEGQLVLSDSEDFEGFYGNCNLFFSAMNLAKWSASFYRGQLMPEGLLMRLMKKSFPGSHLNLLHWYSRDNDREYHFTGHWKGFYTMVYFDIVKKRSIVYLTNHSMDYIVRPRLTRDLIQILERQNISKEKPKPLMVDSTWWNAEYAVESWGKMSFRQNEGQVQVTIDNNTYTVYPLNNVYSYVPGLDLWIWFSDDQARLHLHCETIYAHEVGPIQ